MENSVLCYWSSCSWKEDYHRTINTDDKEKLEKLHLLEAVIQNWYQGSLTWSNFHVRRDIAGTIELEQVIAAMDALYFISLVPHSNNDCLTTHNITLDDC